MQIVAFQRLLTILTKTVVRIIKKLRLARVAGKTVRRRFFAEFFEKFFYAEHTRLPLTLPRLFGVGI